ncbi:MAG TPA: carbon-nitrogen hydrolase family protein [Bryobacteraceae bacterium]|nr:carbon-nitrogen hydrolase family protein [Bryobacteraceae bacterium]
MFRQVFLLTSAVAAAFAAPLDIQQSGFQAASGGVPAGWSVWAARAEIAPRTFVDAVHYRVRPGSLAISGNSNAAEYGGWEYKVPAIQAAKWYRLVAYYRAEGLESERHQVVSRLDWMKTGGGRAGQPDYAYRTERAGEWTRISLDAPAPEGAAAVKLQLYLQNAPYATIWWDEISFQEIPTPKARPVRVASINFHPRETHSAQESVREFLDVIQKSVTGPTDVILLPEGITVVGTGKSYADVAETIPGPTTERLGELARARKTYVVAGIYEREGSAIYNTAVLIDRAGNLTGKYRKVYLPREEIEGGLTPGHDYPVFQTDFGKVGVMICWDLQYTDPARALALRGAEMILMPIWGGNETLAKARAIENRVFLVSSGYDYPTSILDPDGEMLAIARENGTAAVATVDLNRRYMDTWLGDMRERFMKEVRLDVNVDSQ